MPTLPKTDSEFDRYKIKEEPNRPSSTKRGYGRKWSAARLRWLAIYPFCAECEKKGILNNGLPGHPNVVDHIIPHRGNMKIFWDRSNWMTLCEHHHNLKTGRGE